MAVTVPGTGGGIVTLTGGDGDTLGLAQQLSTQLTALSISGSLLISSDSRGGSIAVPAASTPPGGTQTYVVLNGSGSVNATVPGGYDYIIGDKTAPSTIIGSNTTVLTNTVGATVEVTGAGTIAAAGGNNLLSGVGTYVISAGDGADTLLGTGAGMLAGGGGSNVVVAIGANIIVSEGSGDLIISETGNNSVGASGANVGILAGSGEMFVFVSGSGAVVSSGNAQVNATTGGSGGNFFGGSGSSAGDLNVVAGGANNTISTFDSNANISTGGSNALVFGGTGALNADLAGANDTVIGGSGPATINASGNAMVFGGTGHIDFVGGTGTATLLGATGGSENIMVGAGGVLFSAGTSNSSTVTAGAGATTLFGGTGSDINFVGSGAGFIFVGGSGPQTINASGSSTDNTFSGGSEPSSEIRMIGGSGEDLMFAGPGSSTLTGGGNEDIFAFFNSSTDGQGNVVTDFNASGDIVVFSGYSTTQSASSLQNAAIVNGSGVTLTLSDDTTVTFSNLTAASQLNGRILYG